MIGINRRLKLLEAMNYCERNNIVYQVAWTPMDMYRIVVAYREHEEKLDNHLREWEERER